MLLVLETQHYSEAAAQRCSVEKVFLEISQNLHENTCARVSFLIKPKAYSFIKKENIAQVFSCEFCEISKNTFFIEQLWWLLLNIQIKQIGKSLFYVNKKLKFFDVIK